jgi:streptomycin 3"-adenylyltransferase
MDIRKQHRRGEVLNLRQNAVLSGVPEQNLAQLEEITLSLCEIEGSNLIGAYLHGSLAMGCFHRGHSDVDLLVLIEQMPDAERRLAWMQTFLQLSGKPSPIEVSILHRSQYTPWRHPTPSIFHFSEAWRSTLEREVLDGSWRNWEGTEIADIDLAGHFTVARSRGLPLFGAPAATALPEVPWPDYMDSILRDLEWAKAGAAENPTYLILNACRIWAALEDQLVLSKAEGATWAGMRLPSELAPIVARAAAVYAGEDSQAKGSAQAQDALRVAAWIQVQIATSHQKG